MPQFYELPNPFNPLIGGINEYYRAQAQKNAEETAKRKRAQSLGLTAGTAVATAGLAAAAAPALGLAGAAGTSATGGTLAAEQGTLNAAIAAGEIPAGSTLASSAAGSAGLLGAEEGTLDAAIAAGEIPAGSSLASSAAEGFAGAAAPTAGYFGEGGVVSPLGYLKAAGIGAQLGSLLSHGHQTGDYGPAAAFGANTVNQIENETENRKLFGYNATPQERLLFAHAAIQAGTNIGALTQVAHAQGISLPQALKQAQDVHHQQTLQDAYTEAYQQHRGQLDALDISQTTPGMTASPDMAEIGRIQDETARVDQGVKSGEISFQEALPMWQDLNGRLKTAQRGRAIPKGQTVVSQFDGKEYGAGQSYPDPNGGWWTPIPHPTSGGRSILVPQYTAGAPAPEIDPRVKLNPTDLAAGIQTYHTASDGTLVGLPLGTKDYVDPVTGDHHHFNTRHDDKGKLVVDKETFPASGQHKEALMPSISDLIRMNQEQNKAEENAAALEQRTAKPVSFDQTTKQAHDAAVSYKKLEIREQKIQSVRDTFSAMKQGKATKMQLRTSLFGLDDAALDELDPTIRTAALGK